MSIEERDRQQSSQEIFPLETEYLPEFFQKKAEIELNETPENREKCLKQIRKMLSSDKHMVHWEIDDDFVLLYLRFCKYDVNKTFYRLKTGFNLIKKHPKIFSGIDFETLSISTRKKIVTLLPKRCQDGCSILLVQLDNWFPEEFSVEEVKRIVIVLLLQTARDPMTQVNGIKLIFDARSNPLRHIRYCTPSNMHLIYHGSQECLPGRFKEFHIVNVSLTFKAAWLFLKLYIPEKLRRRFFFHSTSEPLLSHFSRSMLPTQYGGDLEDYDITDWLKKVTQPDKLDTLVGKLHT